MLLKIYAEVGVQFIFKNVIGKSTTVMHFCSILCSSFNLNAVVKKKVLSKFEKSLESPRLPIYYCYRL